MAKITHCKVSLWPLEEVDLKPKDRPNLKRQVLSIYRCPSCLRWIYYWYGITKDKGLRTNLTKIPARDFEREWIPRLQTDVMKPDKVTKTDPFVSEWTLENSRGIRPPRLEAVRCQSTSLITNESLIYREPLVCQPVMVLIS